MHGYHYWDQHAKDYDRSMWLLGKPVPRMLELTREAVIGTAVVLEVGAGTGIVTQVLARAAKSVVATDYSSAMVALLEERLRKNGVTNVWCQEADAYSLPFTPASFDAVIAANVLHLLPDLPGALKALRSLLRAGGRLVVPTFCHDQTVVSRALSRLLAITGFPGKRRFRMDTLRAALEGAGLVVTRMELIPGIIPIGYIEGCFG